MPIAFWKRLTWQKKTRSTIVLWFVRHRAQRNYFIYKSNASSVPKSFATVSAKTIFEHSLDACSGTFWYFSVVTPQSLEASMCLLWSKLLPRGRYFYASCGFPVYKRNANTVQLENVLRPWTNGLSSRRHSGDIKARQGHLTHTETDSQAEIFNAFKSTAFRPTDKRTISTLRATSLMFV